MFLNLYTGFFRSLEALHLNCHWVEYQTDVLTHLQLLLRTIKTITGPRHTLDQNKREVKSI
jgi:hypothetical protein